MAKVVKSALEVAFERTLINENEALLEQYDKAGWLGNEKGDALEGDIEKYQMARMLDTTKSVLAMEAAQTTTVFGSNYVPTMMGMIRQVFPRLIGKEIVSIQPLDRPTGKGFRLDLLRDDGSNPENYAQWGAYKEYARHSAGEAAEIQKGMRLTMSSFDINIEQPQKLNVEASLELMQDLRAYHRLDPMELLRGAAVDEIAREIDAHLVQMVYTAAAAHKTVTFGQVPPAGYPADKWPSRLQRAILEANNAIYDAKGVDGTFIICGSGAALELQDLSTFKPSGSFSNDRLGYGLEPVGSLNQQYTVLRSRYLPSMEMVLGRKGSSLLDAGAFWLPYVPLFVSDRVFDVRRQKYDQSFMSRSGKYVAGNQYFARIVIDDDAQGIA